MSNGQFLSKMGQTKQIMQLTKYIPLIQTASFGTLLLWEKFTLIITHTSQSMTQKLKRSRYLKTKFGKAMSCFLATIGQTKQIMKLTKFIPLMQTASFGTLFMWEKFPLIIRHTCQSMMQRLKEIQIS